MAPEEEINALKERIRDLETRLSRFENETTLCFRSIDNNLKIQLHQFGEDLGLSLPVRVKAIHMIRTLEAKKYPFIIDNEDYTKETIVTCLYWVVRETNINLPMQIVSRTTNVDSRDIGRTMRKILTFLEGENHKWQKGGV